MRIINKDALFKRSLYASILVYYSEDFYKIKLEGDVFSINQVLKSGIDIANKVDPNLIELEMIIDDQLNYPIKSTFKASHPFLVKLNQPVLINAEYSLQDDFNSKFADSEIYILEIFRY